MGDSRLPTDANSAVVQNIDAALEQAVSGPASIVSGLGDGIQTVAEMIKTATPIETDIDGDGGQPRKRQLRCLHLRGEVISLRYLLSAEPS